MDWTMDWTVDWTMDSNDKSACIKSINLFSSCCVTLIIMAAMEAGKSDIILISSDSEDS